MRTLLTLFKQEEIDELVIGSRNNYKRNGSCVLCANKIDHLLYYLKAPQGKVKFCRGSFEIGWTPIDAENRDYFRLNPEKRTELLKQQNAGKAV